MKPVYAVEPDGTMREFQSSSACFRFYKVPCQSKSNGEGRRIIRDGQFLAKVLYNKRIAEGLSDSLQTINQQQ